MNFFEKAIAPPPKEESPFLRGVAGPGALRDEDAANGEGVDFPDLFKDAPGRFPAEKRRDADRTPPVAKPQMKPSLVLRIAGCSARHS